MVPVTAPPAEAEAAIESDPTGPESSYGRSKLAGERAVLEASKRHTVARTAWLFGLGGRNFAATMLELAGAADRLAGLVFSAPHRVDRLYVGGEEVVRDGHLVNADEDEIARHHRDHARRFAPGAST